MSDLIDGLAWITSVGALGATCWALRNDSKERRLAATPHLSFTRWTNERDRFLEITLSNKGLGPAKIAAYSFMLDGRAVSALNRDQVQEIADALQLGGTFEKVMDLDKGSMIQVGDTITLLHVTDLQVPAGRNLRETLRRLSIAIEYRSVYGELYPKVEADDRPG